jgi:hypothetical protein
VIPASETSFSDIVKVSRCSGRLVPNHLRSKEITTERYSFCKWIWEVEGSEQKGTAEAVPIVLLAFLTLRLCGEDFSL